MCPRSYSFLPPSAGSKTHSVQAWVACTAESPAIPRTHGTVCTRRGVTRLISPRGFGLTWDAHLEHVQPAFDHLSQLPLLRVFLSTFRLSPSGPGLEMTFATAIRPVLARGVCFALVVVGVVVGVGVGLGGGAGAACCDRIVLARILCAAIDVLVLAAGPDVVVGVDVADGVVLVNVAAALVVRCGDVGAVSGSSRNDPLWYRPHPPPRPHHPGSIIP
eukprot:330285-Rhodomonas_salina.7